MLELGVGVVPDFNGALKWYPLAAEKNEPYAQFNLGAIYAGGEKVKRDFAEAVKWLRLAAAQNHPDALFGLGSCYKQGLGVDQDIFEARRFFQKAKEAGSEEAQRQIEEIDQFLKRKS